MKKMCKTQFYIKLRPIEVKDAQILMELNNNRQISDYVVGNPQIVDLKQQLQWIEKIGAEKSVRRWMVCLNDEAVGTIFISSIDFANSTGNVNIKLLPSHQGKGIAYIALKLLCDIAFDELNLYCLTANILSYNTRSQHLFEKVGFRVDGILRSRILKNGERHDLVTLSLLKEERCRE